MANYPAYNYQPPATPWAMPQQPQQGAVPPMVQPMPPQIPGPRIAVRQVASEMEAASIPTPFDGSVLVLTDLGHGMIYVKALNCNDGTAIFERFGRQPPPPPTPAVEYAPLDMVEQLRQQVAALEAAATAKQPPRGGQKEAAKT